MTIRFTNFVSIYIPTFKVGESKVQVLKICVTFDVDFTDYLTDGKSDIDEFESIFPSILSVLEKEKGFKATWFIRLDSQLEALYGQPDYILHRYGKELDCLSLAGHEIGWHPHFYVKGEGGWRQNLEAAKIMDELIQYTPLAQSYGMKSVRMGWGFHTNETMRLLADLRFLIDSSAIPRPRYRWEESEKDWTLTPVVPYFPSESDYRVPGKPGLPILEIPMSVAPIKAPYDTEQVMRYINLAYHPDLLRGPLEYWLREYSHLITVTHPYELFSKGESHGLLAFDLRAFEQNLQMIKAIAGEKGISVSFLTLCKFATMYEGENHASLKPANP
jgi:hypothetical protein